MRFQFRVILLFAAALLATSCTTPPPAPTGPNCAVLACVALTFDGGPNSNTAQILDILAHYNAQATFFVIGRKIRAAPELVTRMAGDGHEVGNHSWSHVPLPRLSDAQILTEIAATNQAITNITDGYIPQLFRLPYGSTSPRVNAILPMPSVLWNLDSNDWAARSSAEIIQRVSRARPGMIVLMHSFLGRTVRALPQIVQTLQNKGFTLVTVSQLRAPPP